MKAFVFKSPGVIEKTDLPAPGIDYNKNSDRFSAVLKPRFLSPCSSDAHTVYAGNGPRRENLVLGHEGLAEVVETGPEVRDFRPGDLVAVSAVMPEPGDPTGHRGTPFSGMKLGRGIDGMWSELFKIPEADCNLAHIPEGLGMEAALMAVDMMATGYTAAEAAGILPGQTVLIIGSGAVGQMAAFAAKKAAGPEGRVIMAGSDRDPVHAELARLYGADIFLSYRDGKAVFSPDGRQGFHAGTRDPRANAAGSPLVDAVFSVTDGYGADRVLICGGGQETLVWASDIVRYGDGVVVNMAYIEGAGFVQLPIFSLGRGMSGKTFKFELSRGGRAWTERMLREAAEADGLPARLVTNRLRGFDSIPEALKLMRDRPQGIVKVMVEI